MPHKQDKPKQDELEKDKVKTPKPDKPDKPDKPEPNEPELDDKTKRRPEHLSNKRLEIVQAAREWLNVRWVHQGRTKLGIDCAGLVLLVGNGLQLTDYDTTDYQRRTTGNAFLQHFNNNFDRKLVADRLPGDIIVMRDSYFPCHCGILAADHLGNETIIHAYAARRKVVEDRLNQGDYLARLVAIFSYRGI